MMHYFYRRLIVHLKIYGWLLLLLWLFRLLFFFSYCDISDILTNYKGGLLMAIWTGFRCDTVIICYLLALPFALNLLGFVCIFGNLQKKYDRFLHIFSKIYSSLAFFAVYWIGIVDYFYYRNFQTHFDARLLGIVDDGTKEVMASVWSDYPVITVILVFLILLFGWIKLISRIEARPAPKVKPGNIALSVSAVLLSTALLFLGARSSLSEFPFQKNALVFSPNLSLNDMAANGVYMLNYYLSSREEINIDLSRLPADYGFSSFDEAKEIWGTPQVTDTSTIFAQKATAQRDSSGFRPPNVVLILMEGWSSDFFNFHSEHLNLLGALEAELPQLVHYPFCFPVNFGTNAAMETFFTSNVSTSLSLSAYANDTLKSSTALAFRKAGYETTYHTSGYLGWRSMGEYCRTQGFDHVLGAEHLRTVYPQAKTADWGVFDEYLFNSVYEKLQEDTAQPQFFLCMTITNHSPHKIPGHYQPYVMQLPDSLAKRATSSKKQTLEALQTFQYANDCLGKFFHKLRSSPAGSNTIVIVTGDHSMTGGFMYKDAEILFRWAVPLVFHIPADYRPAAAIDTRRLVSHKDILPTIYHLALSNYTYTDTGDNIFDPATAGDAFTITQHAWAMNGKGVVNLHNNQQEYALQGYYLSTENVDKEAMEKLRRKANAWLFGMKWQLYSDLNNIHRQYIIPR